MLDNKHFAEVSEDELNEVSGGKFGMNMNKPKPEMAGVMICTDANYVPDAVCPFCGQHSVHNIGGKLFCRMCDKEIF